MRSRRLARRMILRRYAEVAQATPGSCGPDIAIASSDRCVGRAFPRRRPPYSSIRRPATPGPTHPFASAEFVRSVRNRFGGPLPPTPLWVLVALEFDCLQVELAAGGQAHHRLQGTRGG